MLWVQNADTGLKIRGNQGMNTWNNQGLHPNYQPRFGKNREFGRGVGTRLHTFMTTIV